MTDTNPNSEQPEHKTENQSEESLAERSARLEAEAAGLASQDNDAQDPLAPQATPEANIPADEAAEFYAEKDALSVDESAISLAALQREYEETKDKMIRAVAEAENARKRAIKEREDARKYSIAGFSKDLVNVADNLRRALEAVPAELLAEHEQLKGLVGGIEATEREMLRAFEKNGIQKVAPEEVMFDPNQHEAMFEVPGTGKPAGTIIQVIEPGYMLHDRLLRPARVGIAKDEGGEAAPHVDTQA